MIREKENSNLLSANIKKNLNVIKAYFEKKNAICQNIEENIYEYTYEDKFRSTDIEIACYFNLKGEKALIKISSDFKEDESIYEVENLFNRIFSELFQILLAGDEKYVVRIYGSYFLEKPIQFHNTFKWKNNLNLCAHIVQGRERTYNVEQLTVCPKEQILYCDIEVNAYNLSAARSMAYLSPSEYNDKNDGIPYITGASNFKNGHISLVRWTPVPQVITRRGDLLMTCKGTIGEIAYNNFGEAHIARQIMAIRNNYSLNVDFLALCIEYSMTKIKQAANGLIPGISREDILNLVIPIPPTKEQENICNKLKATFSAIEHIEKSLN